MNDFLIKKFVKNYEDTKSAAVRESYGRLASLVGIVSNLVLCSFKIFVGIVFSSVSILADGINNLSDASASLITLVGFKLAGRKPDKDHPYGHGRTEYLTGLVISVMILVIGVELFKSSLDKTLHPEPLDFSMLSVAVLAGAIAIKLWQSSFNAHIGNIIDSDTLKATAADSRNDVLSTAAVLVSLLVGRFTSLNPDGPVGILVALFITWSGISLIRETISPILGQAPDEAMVEELKSMVLAHPGVLGVHDMIIHDYGPGRIFATIHVEVDGRADIMESHDMMDNIEVEAYNKMNILLTCHMDPLMVGDPQVMLASSRLEEIVSRYDDLSGLHDVRIVSGPTHTNVIFDIVLAFDSKRTPGEVKEQLTADLKAFDPRYETVIAVDRAYA